MIMTESCKWTASTLPSVELVLAYILSGFGAMLIDNQSIIIDN